MPKPLILKNATLPEKFEPNNALHVEQVLSYLLNNAPQSPDEASAWYGLFQDLSTTLTEEHSQLELNIHLDVLSQKNSNALQKFEIEVLALLLNARQKLSLIYLDSPWKHSMHADDKGQLEQDLRARLPLSIPGLAKWQLKESQLVHKYKEHFNQINLTWQGRTVPLSVVNGYLSHHNEATRKEAFFAYWGTLNKQKETLEGMFYDLVYVRRQLAQEAKLTNFAECAFLESGRFSYSPKDCQNFNQKLQEGQNRYLTPVLEVVKQSRPESIDVTLPWNFQSLAACLNETTPRHKDLAELIENTSQMLHGIHTFCGKLFDSLHHNQRIDIYPRGGKAGGAFCVNFPKSKVPFIFGNFSPRFKDSVTFVHEFGHAFHSHLSSNISNHLMRTPPMDFCEFASSVFEFLALENLQHWFTDKQGASAAKKQHLVSTLAFFPLMSCIDEFQHRVYEPTLDLSRSTIGELWTQVSNRHRSQIDWSQCPEFEELGWLCRSHVFTSPFYFFEYGLAYLSALEFMSGYKQNPEQSLLRFFSALQLGGQRKLPELFAEAGVGFCMERQLTKKDPISTLEDWASQIQNL
jgi:oligoendopeptidase F